MTLHEPCVVASPGPPLARRVGALNMAVRRYGKSPGNRYRVKPLAERPSPLCFR
jgi:hypothetical protein